MGSGRFDSVTYASTVSSNIVRARRLGISEREAAFFYTTDTKTKPQAQWKVHETLDPLLIKGVRESRDNDEHPTTVPTAVIFDDTGSMRLIPQIFQEKLPKLMELLTTTGKIKHPHVLFGSIGDAYTDKVPFQVGQFESDNRCDDQLRNVFLEGGGGGGYQESYELALYFAGFKTSLDSWEKRQQKGFLFTIGDECFYPSLSANTIKRVFGDNLQVSELSFKELLAKTMESFEYFHIHCASDSAHAKDPTVINTWRDAIDQRLLLLDDNRLVCETIAGVVALYAGGKLDELDDAAVAKSLVGLKTKRKFGE